MALLASNFSMLLFSMEPRRNVELVVENDGLDTPNIQWSNRLYDIYGPVDAVRPSSVSDRTPRNLHQQRLLGMTMRHPNPIEKMVLRRLVRKNKVSRLVDNFIAKLKRNVAFEVPVDDNLDG